MRPLLALALLLSAFSAVAAPATKQTRYMSPVGIDKVTGNPYFLLQDMPAKPEVYRGTRSVAGEFPMMGWIGNCTATAVARDVVFTAAHCQRDGARINFAHRGSGVSYAATCNRHPNYNSRTIANDWVLCKLDRPLPENSVLASFKIDEAPASGTDVLVNGYGAPNVGTHYWGKSSIRSYSGQDIVTCGPANLGGGDSGGSLLLWTDDRTGASHFDIIGVNSRGNNSCSWYNRVSDPVFVSFAKAYEQSKGVKLCGISADCKGGDADGGGDDDGDPIPDCAAELASLNETLAKHSAAVAAYNSCVNR